MTAEQETELILKIGRMEANMENWHGDTKKALNLMTGNGRPQDGILTIMTDVRRGIELLNTWVKDHGLIHTAINECITVQDKRLNELEKTDAVNEATKGTDVKKSFKEMAIEVLCSPAVRTTVIIIITGVLATLASRCGFNPREHHPRPIPTVVETPR
jgi:hypothetical protein